MGFHQNIYYFKESHGDKDYDFKTPTDSQELAYFSKQYQLQSWMEKLYMKKKGDVANAELK